MVVTDHQLAVLELLSTARRCPASEDRHVHHSLCVPVSPPDHLHPAVPVAQAPYQPPRHPQEPGGSALLLRACLPPGHQPD